jgi:hypothetical protein
VTPTNNSSNSVSESTLSYAYDIRMNVTLGSAIPNATRYIYTGYLGIQQQLLQALSEYSSMKLLKIRHK